MANQSQRGGMKQTKSQTGSEQKHQGVHLGSSTQSDAKNEKHTGSRNTPGADPHAGEQVVPKKDRYDSDES
jgi:hypothetical protein